MQIRDRDIYEKLILLMKRALQEPTRGLAAAVTVEENAFEWLGRFADGDARRALTALEAAAAQLLSEEEYSGSSNGKRGAAAGEAVIWQSVLSTAHANSK